jgi:hypothetical protein
VKPRPHRDSITPTSARSMTSAKKAAVNRLDLATGRKQPWKQLVPPDVSGVTDISSVLITPDGNNHVYEYGRTLSDLYLVNDLK